MERHSSVMSREWLSWHEQRPREKWGNIFYSFCFAYKIVIVCCSSQHLWQQQFAQPPSDVVCFCPPVYVADASEQENDLNFKITRQEMLCELIAQVLIKNIAI